MLLKRLNNIITIPTILLGNSDSDGLRPWRSERSSRELSWYSVQGYLVFQKHRYEWGPSFRQGTETLQKGFPEYLQFIRRRFGMHHRCRQGLAGFLQFMVRKTRKNQILGQEVPSGLAVDPTGTETGYSDDWALYDLAADSTGHVRIGKSDARPFTPWFSDPGRGHVSWKIRKNCRILVFVNKKLYLCRVDVLVMRNIINISILSLLRNFGSWNSEGICWKCRILYNYPGLRVSSEAFLYNAAVAQQTKRKQDGF